MSQAPVVAVDIGGTRLKLGVVGPQGDLLHTTLAATEAGTPGLLGRVLDLIATVVDDHQPAAVGVATAGVVDVDRGRIIGGSSNLPGWVGTEVAEGITARFGLPAAVDNDVNAAALGEFWAGAGQGCRVLLVVMVGTGLGAGLVLDGHLYHGAHWGGMDISYEAVPNVPVGYYPNPHSAECAIGLAALRVLVKQAREAGRDTVLPPDFEIGDLFRAADASDSLAVELRDQAVGALITVLANLTPVLDPDRVLLGGGVIEAGGAALLQQVESSVRARLLGPRQDWFDLRPMVLGEHAGVLGAAKLAFDRLDA